MTDDIANKIKRFRKIKKMSQEDLAQISGINISTIKKYESGYRNPKPDQILKIANALGVSINALMSYDITSLSDVLCLIIKLHQEAGLQIDGEKDADGKYNSDTIRMSFSESDINRLIAQYLNFFELKNHICGTGELCSETEKMSYQYKIDGLLLNIEGERKRHY